MIFPEIKPIKRQTEKVSELMGMDVRPVIADGNFSYLKNFSNEEYPTFIPMRKMSREIFDFRHSSERAYSLVNADQIYIIKRELEQDLEFNLHAYTYVCDINHNVIAQNEIVYVNRDPEDAKIVTCVIGNKIVMFPDKVVFDCESKEFINIETEWIPSYTYPTTYNEDDCEFRGGAPQSITKGNTYTVTMNPQHVQVDQDVLEEAYNESSSIYVNVKTFTISYGTSSKVTINNNDVSVVEANVFSVKQPDGSYAYAIRPKIQFKSSISSKNVTWYKLICDLSIRPSSENDVYARITLLDTNGEEITNVSEDEKAPTDPKGGDYWIDKSVTPSVMKIWDENAGRWVQVISSNYKVEILGENVPDEFNEYDTVNFHTLHTDGYGKELIDEDLEGEWTIKKISTDRKYFVISAVFPKIEYEYFNTFNITRDCPDLDYLCVNDNRVWGCNISENTIYASKLGDPYNWYGYEDLSTDSYALEVASVGAFSGMISLNSSVFVFKENCIHRIYGTKPQNYSLKTFENVNGMKKNNWYGCVHYNGYIYYCAVDGIYAFDGGNMPVKISDPLGDVNCEGIGYYNDHIFIFCPDDYAYDLKRGTWKRFGVYSDNNIYAHMRSNVLSTGNGMYMIRGSSQYAMDWYENGVNEDYQQCTAITGNIGIMYDNHKYLSRLIVRAELNENSKLTISVSYDDGEFLKVYEKTGKQNNEAVELPIIPRRCDHMKIKFETTGFVRLYSYTKEFEGGSMYGKH